MRVLFIVPYSSKGASNRYRVKQYLPYLKKEGIDYDIRPFVFARFYNILYIKGKYFIKIAYFIIALLNRAFDIFRMYRYDVVFIHREACPLGPPIFEWLFYILRKPMIFDFDDAIFLRNFHPNNKMYRFFKFSSKTKSIIKMASAVIVANNFLAGYARRFNKNVYIIPTPIDTDSFITTKKGPRRLTIGWIGSPTTVSYLKPIYNALKRLGQSYDFIFKVVGGDTQIVIENVAVENRKWDIGTEVEEFQSIDIGVYPLPDTIWARGKAAFKAIQYMAVGVPVVASPVGMNAELIEEGLNGFLATTEEEWLDKISRLIKEPGLRERIGLAGRRTAEERFSVKVNAPQYLEIIKLVQNRHE